MDKIKVKIKKLHEDSIIPQYQTAGASGFDIHALENFTILPMQTVLIRTGLAFEIPEGYELQIRPRSGLSLRTQLRVANSPGTIDSDYRGEVLIMLENTNKEIHDRSGRLTTTLSINKGDRIAQGVICPVFRAEFVEEELTDTERGAGGFGSTNK